MGNHQSGSGSGRRPRKNVHWKSAECPSPPGKPELVPAGGAGSEEGEGVTLRWAPPRRDGGAPLAGYRVECNRLGSEAWVRTAPPLVARPELLLTGLEPGHHYQFRVSACNPVGVSAPGEISDILTVSLDRAPVAAPVFIRGLADASCVESDKIEFKVFFEGSPPPTVCWFKDGYEIFSSRRTSILTEGNSSALIFHQASLGDEGEIKCTATNRSGHAVSRARLSLKAAPRIRLPRQYEEGLLYETGETIFLKVAVAGKPAPEVEWRHDGRLLLPADRIHIANTDKFSTLRIENAIREDRGEYQINSKNAVGEDSASFLVTITARPDPPVSLTVAQNADKSVSLSWVSPNDDGGCQVGNYVIEYYRTGWNVWLKAATSRKLTATLFDLIEGSEYRFRVKAESPYGMSEPSAETRSIFIPGKAADSSFDAMGIVKDTPSNRAVVETPQAVPRRKRHMSPKLDDTENVKKITLELPVSSPAMKLKNMNEKSKRTNILKNSNSEKLSEDYDEDKMRHGSSEFMLVLYPESEKTSPEKRKSFQLDLEDAMSPPPLSLSAPELGYSFLPIRPLRNSVSSTELLHERAMNRFYQVIALKEAEKVKAKKDYIASPTSEVDIKVELVEDENTTNNSYNSRMQEQYQSNNNKTQEQYQNNNNKMQEQYQSNNNKMQEQYQSNNNKMQEQYQSNNNKMHEQYQNEQIEESKMETNDSEYLVSNESLNKEKADDNISNFEDDYTASTVSTGDSEFTDSDSLGDDVEQLRSRIDENATYHPKEMIYKGGTQSQAVEVLTKPAPLPDPNFIPKPILKKREPDVRTSPPKAPASSEKLTKYPDPLVKKVPLFKKFAKFPLEKHILNSKKKNSKNNKKGDEDEKTVSPKEVKDKKKEDVTQDEGRTVAEHYGNIVKEFGSSNKPQRPQLYTNTNDLKKAAARQIKRSDIIGNDPNKTASVKPTAKRQETPQKPMSTKIMNKQKKEDTKVQVKPSPPQPRLVPTKPSSPIETVSVSKSFSELNAEAESTVRSVINYIIDVFMLLVAFWLYLFKDERLAIPFLGLTMYRQVHSVVRKKIPSWFNNKKSSSD